MMSNPQPPTADELEEMRSLVDEVKWHQEFIFDCWQTTNQCNGAKHTLDKVRRKLKKRYDKFKLRDPLWEPSDDKRRA